MDIRGEIESVMSEMDASTDSSPESASPETPSPDPSTETATPAIQESAETVAAKASPPPPAVPSAQPMGTIPVTRHQEILNKHRAELEETRKRYAWAEGLDPTDMQRKVALLKYAEENPVEYLRMFQQELSADPRYAQQLQTPKDDAMPEPDRLTSDGELTYSPQRMRELLEWQERRVEGKVTSRFEQTFGPIKQEYEQAKTLQRVHAKASTTLQEARTTWPGFSENEPEMKQAMLAARQAGQILSLDQAYRQIVVPRYKDGIEKAKAEERTRVLAEMKQKATVHPERPTQAIPAASRPSQQHRSVRDIVADVMAEQGR